MHMVSAKPSAFWPTMTCRTNNHRLSYGFNIFQIIVRASPCHWEIPPNSITIQPLYVLSNPPPGIHQQREPTAALKWGCQSATLNDWHVEDLVEHLVKSTDLKVFNQPNPKKPCFVRLFVLVSLGIFQSKFHQPKGWIIKFLNNTKPSFVGEPWLE